MHEQFFIDLRVAKEIFGEDLPEGPSGYQIAIASGTVPVLSPLRAWRVYGREWKPRPFSVHYPDCLEMVEKTYETLYREDAPHASPFSEIVHAIESKPNLPWEVTVFTCSNEEGKRWFTDKGASQEEAWAKACLQAVAAVKEAAS